MKNKLNIAVIGCGNIANSAHIPAYMKNDKVNIKYFCDIIPERAQDAVGKYGCGTAVTDYKDILADSEIDAVSVCTPNYAHAEISNAFLKAGKTVLCEKPAARTYACSMCLLLHKNTVCSVIACGLPMHPKRNRQKPEHRCCKPL